MAKTPVVLGVDDDLHVVDILESVLRTNGFDPISAADGEEALQLVKEKKPDLILLDVNLPDMMGYDVCQAIRQDPMIKTTPIFMLTGHYSQASDKVKGLDMGADDYIVKPFDSDILLARVQALLRRSE